MDHTKEPERYYVDTLGDAEMHLAEDGEYVLYADYSYLRFALAEKTAQHEEAWRKIEWLREALKRQFWRAQSYRKQEEKLREALVKIEQETWAPYEERMKVLAIAREAIAATIPGKEYIGTFARFETRSPGMTDADDCGGSTNA